MKDIIAVCAKLKIKATSFGLRKDLLEDLFSGDIGAVILMALLPAAGTLSGILLAEWKKPPPWVTGTSLHAAAGFATAIAALDLVPRAQERIAIWQVAVAFLAGAILSLFLSRIHYRITRSMGQETASGIWGAYFVVIVDLAIDGLFTGSGASISRGLGLMLALSQLIANMPGGLAVAAGLRADDVPSRFRHVSLLLFPLTPILCALIGFLLLRGAGPTTKGFVIALLAGLLLVATIEDLVPAADQPGAPRKFSSPAFAAGFVTMLLTSTYLEA